MRYVAGIVVVVLALCLLKEAWEVWPIDDAEVKAITTLSTPQAYRLVKKSWFWRRGWLDLSGVATLSDEAARALRAGPDIRLPAKFWHDARRGLWAKDSPANGTSARISGLMSDL